MLKKIKKLLLTILMIVPLMFVFAGCNGDGGNPPGNQNTSTVQPSKPGGEDPKPQSSNYTVAVNYNLPGKLSEILPSENVVKKTSESYVLPTFNNSNLKNYFEGWFYESNEQIPTDSIHGTKDQTIKITARWSNDILENYYTAGLEFDVNEIDNTATVVGYSGNEKLVVIPKSYVQESNTFEIVAIESKENDFSDIDSVIILADSISISESAFENSKVQNFDFSAVSSLGGRAFANSGVKEIVLLQKLTEMGESVFSGCIALEKVDLSNCSIDTIQKNSFAGCSNLSDVKLSEDVIRIAESAFENCVKLQNVSFLNGNIKIIGNYAFKGCTGIQTVALGEGVESIGGFVFDGCKIQSATLSKIYTEYSMNAIFGNSINFIKEVSLSGNIETIPTNYFANLASLEKFVMCNTITGVEERAFAGCTNLADITFSISIEGSKFNANAFFDTKFYRQNDSLLILNGSILLVPMGLPSNLTAADFEGVTEIASEVFKENSNIETLEFPNTLVSIGDNAFDNCENLQSVTFEDGSNLTNIGMCAFINCANLTNVDLSNCSKLETIGNYAFQGSGNIDQICLSGNIKTFGDGAFLFSRVNNFVLSGVSEKFVVEDGILYEISSNEKIAICAYSASKTNQTFVVPSTITSIYDGVFSNDLSLKYLYVNSSLELGEFNSKVDILTTKNLVLPLNTTNVYKQLTLNEADYNFDGGVLNIVKSFEGIYYEKYFVEVSDGDKNYRYIVIVIGEELSEINDITDFVFEM